MSWKGKSTHPLCPCKAFLTDGLLIRWNENGDFSGNEKLSGIRMGMGNENENGNFSENGSGIRMRMAMRMRMGILVEIRVE